MATSPSSPKPLPSLEVEEESRLWQAARETFAGPQWDLFHRRLDALRLELLEAAGRASTADAAWPYLIEARAIKRLLDPDFSLSALHDLGALTVEEKETLDTRASTVDSAADYMRRDSDGEEQEPN